MENESARTDDFADLDALDQVELLRRRKVSPLELIDAAIARIQRTNSRLNAVIVPLFEQALAAAKSGSIPNGPFRGVPFLLKDLGAAYGGDPLYMGMKFLRDAKSVALHDTYLGAKFKAAGFVCLGKTNTPELGLIITTEPQAFGPSRNPWDVTRSTGGSSGGSAAAVGERMRPGRPQAHARARVAGAGHGRCVARLRHRARGHAHGARLGGDTRRAGRQYAGRSVRGAAAARAVRQGAGNSSRTAAGGRDAADARGLAAAASGLSRGDRRCRQGAAKRRTRGRRVASGGARRNVIHRRAVHRRGREPHRVSARSDLDVLRQKNHGRRRRAVDLVSGRTRRRRLGQPLPDVDTDAAGAEPARDAMVGGWIRPAPVADAGRAAAAAGPSRDHARHLERGRKAHP